LKLGADASVRQSSSREEESEMMNLMLLGPANAGKGTQAKRLTAEFRIPQISTGDILRQAVKDGTELGKKAGPLMSAGQLVPDELVIGIVRERLAQPDCREGFILDGFPRTVPQAEALDKVLGELGKQLTGVVSLEVPDEVLAERAAGRRSCPKDGSVYHVTQNPPKVTGRCDVCGGELVQREDDKPEKVKARMVEYRQKTEPLKAYYEKRGLLRQVEGVGSPEGIFAEVRRQLGQPA
jgi:adenylate kinase